MIYNVWHVKKTLHTHRTLSLVTGDLLNFLTRLLGSRYDLRTWSKIVCAFDLYRRTDDLTLAPAVTAALLRRVDDNIADSPYNYIPTEWICIMFVALFGVSTCESSFSPC
jgi:hypothetical protein